MFGYFKKLDFKLPDMDMSRIVGGPLQEGYGETFRSWDILELDYFNSLVAKSIKFNIQPSFVNYTEITSDGAGPHVDVAGVAINYYIEPANAITVFWNLKDLNLSVPNTARLNEDGKWIESPVRVYKMSDIERVGYFKAVSHEAWLLNTSRIHSVIKPNLHNTRTVIRWIWIGPVYEEILNSIEIL
jgi:hypothetical protein